MKRKKALHNASSIVTMFDKLRNSRKQSALVHPQSLACTLHTIGAYGKLSNYFSEGITELQRDQKEKKQEKMEKKG